MLREPLNLFFLIGRPNAALKFDGRELEFVVKHY